MRTWAKVLARCGGPEDSLHPVQRRLLRLALQEWFLPANDILYIDIL